MKSIKVTILGVALAVAGQFASSTIVTAQPQAAAQKAFEQSMKSITSGQAGVSLSASQLQAVKSNQAIAAQIFSANAAKIPNATADQLTQEFSKAWSSTLGAQIKDIQVYNAMGNVFKTNLTEVISSADVKRKTSGILGQVAAAGLALSTVCGAPSATASAAVTFDNTQQQQVAVAANASFENKMTELFAGVNGVRSDIKDHSRRLASSSEGFAGQVDAAIEEGMVTTFTQVKAVDASTMKEFTSYKNAAGQSIVLPEYLAQWVAGTTKLLPAYLTSTGMESTQALEIARNVCHSCGAEFYLIPAGVDMQQACSL